ncbi:MAG: hypothetical protein EPO68_04510 [Planctomycetota bacterium]|nr:MAG: hypothetical protein EPO68_04510 [Planctomycetota bacterium]
MIRTRLSLRLVAAPCLLCLPALAQVVPQRDLLIVDDAQNQDQILVARDIDSDGFWASQYELGTVYQNLGNWITTAEYTTEAGVPVAYWYDQKVTTGTPSNGLGAIWRGADSNSDGSFTGGEVTLFYDFGTLEGKLGGDGLAVAADGAVWWSGGTVANITETDKGLFRCRDLNADGDAMDAGETAQLINGMAGSFTVETDAGPKSMDGATLRRLAEDGNGVIAYEDGLDEAAFRFEDINNDGDLLDAGEARLFLNATAKNALLPQNPDWASGALRSLLVSVANNTYGRLSHVATRTEGATRVYYLACDSSNTSQFKQNFLGQGINGLIFRGLDQNLDNDINDAGEVILYYDGSTTSYSAFEIGKVVGLDGSADGMYVCDYNGANRVHFLQDLNADGDANDGGEQVQAAWDSVNYQGAAPIPAAPFVNDIAVAPAGAFQFGWSISGTPCSYFGPLPQIRASGTPKLGTTGFAVRVENGLPGLPAILYLGASTTTWAGVPLPLDLTVLGLSGCTLYQDLAFSLKGFMNASGTLSKTLTIPADPGLNGVPVPFQWVVIEPIFAQLGLSALGVATLYQ